MEAEECYRWLSNKVDLDVSAPEVWYVDRRHLAAKGVG
jgi:hypothetical protein